MQFLARKKALTNYADMLSTVQELYLVRLFLFRLPPFCLLQFHLLLFRLLFFLVLQSL